MAKKVIMITEFEGDTDKFIRSYMLNNLDKGGIVFGHLETNRAMARIGQLKTNKKIWIDVFDLDNKSVELNNVL
ncbi:MAG: hypothetical protein LKF43_00305 [Streptococcaceae bacterium]|jgi:hypothetical protein|nr:hypothetical protein [Streptococcaceae bacterium]